MVSENSSNNIEDRRTPEDIAHEDRVQRFLTNSDLSPKRLSDKEIKQVLKETETRIKKDRASIGDMEAYYHIINSTK